MRLAVFSDTHGNCYALDVMLRDAREQAVDGMVCLGDAVQSGPQPAELVQRLREHKIPTVMGNSDAWLITGVETDAELISDERRKILNAVREWSLSQLSDADRAFIAAFPMTITLPLGKGRRLLCFHGSPASFDQFILPSTPEQEFQTTFQPYAEHICAGGHMHLQFTRRFRDSQNFFVNPGSVGVAYNHEQSDENGLLDPWADYAVLTVDGMFVSLEFRRVPLDLKLLADVYRHSGRPFADKAPAQYVNY